MSASLIEAIHAAGLAPVKDLDLQPDGKLRRFRAAGDKPGSRNGWAVQHGGPVSAGAFGSWRTGESHTWCARDLQTLTLAERAAQQRQLDAMRQARAAELAKVQASARERAARLWALARPATDQHRYLQRKGVPAVGIRQLRDSLVIPARDARRRLSTLQFISPDGDKRFLTGGRLAGCYFAIGQVSDSLLLCEGLATGLTVFAATGAATGVCFSAGNLRPVALALREKFPRLRITICADDDAHTPGNPGLCAAQAAARAVAGLVATPCFVVLP